MTEQRTHFGLWCALSSPLTLSLDFANTTAVDSVWGIITNTHALAVNQAWAGSQGTIFASAPDSVVLHAQRSGEAPTRIPTWQAWYKPLPHGGAAVFVANHGNSPEKITIQFADVPSYSAFGPRRVSV